MAWTDYMKKRLMDTEAFNASDKYIALATSSTELSGHGYQRGRWRTSNMNVSAAGVVTGARFEIYSATDGSAQRATRIAVFDAASGGNMILGWENISSPPAAPTQGQAVNVTPSVTP